MEEFLKFIFSIDKSQLERALLDTEKQAKKTADNVEKTLGGAFKAVAASIAGLGIGRLFNTAIKEANEFEKAMLGVAASAKLVGQDVTRAQSNVIALAEDGQIALKDSAEIMKMLSAAGLSAQKSLDFAQAGKKIASFNGLLGTSSESLKSFTKFLLSGEAELADNLDPALKSVIKSLGGYEKVASDATAKQKLINIVIERGTLLQGDYNKFLQTGAAAQQKFSTETDKLLRSIGDGLQGAFGSILGILTPVIQGVTKFLDSLGPTSKSILLIGTTLTVLIPIVVGAANGIKAMTSAATGLQGVLKVLGLSPTVLAFTALAAAITAAATAINYFTSASERNLKSITEEVRDIRLLNQEYKTNKGFTDSSADGKAKLADFNIKLAQTAEKLGVSLRKENGELKTTLDILKEFDKIELRKIDKDIAGLVDKLDNIRDNAALRQTLTPDELKDYEQRVSKELDARILQRNLLKTPLGEDNSNFTTVNMNKGGVKKELEDNLFRLDDFTKKLIGINKEYADQVAFIKQAAMTEKEREDALQDTAAVRLIKFDEALEEEQKKLEEAGRTELQIALDNNKKEAEIKIQTARNVRDAELVLNKEGAEGEEAIKKKAADRVFKINEDRRKKDLQAELKNVQTIAEGTQTVLQSAYDFVSGDKGVASFLKGAGGIAGVFDPATGAILNAASGIADIFESIFDNTEELKKQEEERKRVIEEQTKLLEAQRKTAEILRDLEREKSNLIDKETDTQLKLNKLLFTDEATRKQKDAEAVQKLIDAKAKQAGLEAGSPTQIADQINVLNQQTLENGKALQALGNLTSLQGNESVASLKNILTKNIAVVAGVRSSVTDEAIKQELTALETKLQSALLSTSDAELDRRASAAQQADINKFGRNISTTDPRVFDTYRSAFAAALPKALKESLERAGSGTGFNLANIGGIQDVSVERLKDSEKLLDTLLQFQDLTKTGAGGVGLSLTDKRQESIFIDAIRGGVVDPFKNFLQGVTTNVRPELSGGIAQIALATQTTGKSVNEKILSVNEKQLDVLQKMLVEIVSLNKKFGSQGLTPEQIFIKIFGDMQQNVY